MIKFSARGEEFSIPKKLLEKYPDSMLYALIENANNIPTDKVNNCIYLDINSFTIDSIIDYYNLGSVRVSNIFTAMDLKYLGLNIEHAYCILPCMSRPIIYSKEIVNEIQLPTCMSKYYKIHTSNNKIIIIDISLYNIKNLNILNSMFYIDEKNDTPMFLNVHVSATDVIMNVILTILRDGLNWYYEYLTNDKKCYYKMIMDNYKYILDETEFDMSKYSNKPLYDEYVCSDHDFQSYSYYTITNCEKCQMNYKDQVYQNIKEIICEEYGYNNCDYTFPSLQFDLNKDLENSIRAIRTIIDGMYTNIEKWLNDNSNDKIDSINMKTKILNYLRLYKVCDEYTETQLKNRLDRVNLLNIRDDISYYYNDDALFFSEKENKNGQIVLVRDSDKILLYNNLIKYYDKFKIFAEKLNIKKEKNGYHTIEISQDSNIQLTNLMIEYLDGL